MGLLDYPQIVKNPMDLATCKEKLLSGKYSTYEEVFNEIQLIWDNCKLYNMIGCEIYKVCERMEKMAKRQVQKFRAAHGLPQPASAAPSRSTMKRSAAKAIDDRGAARAADRDRGATGGGRNAAAHEESKHQVALGGMDAYGDGGDGKLGGEKITVDMKMDLVAKVKKLSNEGLTKMVKHVQLIAQAAMSDLEDERVQIRIDDFDRDTFNSVLDFIEEILLSEQPSKR